MFRKLMYPRGEGKLRNCGKGGAEGDAFMIGHALHMLRQQGHDGEPSSVMTPARRSPLILGHTLTKLSLHPHYTLTTPSLHPHYTPILLHSY